MTKIYPKRLEDYEKAIDEPLDLKEYNKKNTDYD